MWHTSFLLRAHHAHAQYILKAVEEPIIQLLQIATYYSKNYSRIISSGLLTDHVEEPCTWYTQYTMQNGVEMLL